MEFVETPTFWCPHVDRAACNNFSTWIVELRPSERLEILHFFFSFSLSFPFPFLFYELFFPWTVFFLFSFFISFFFFFSFFSFSHLIFPSLLFFVLIFFSFSLLIFFFSPFLDHHGAFGQRRKLPPPFLMQFVAHIYFFLISFLFMTSYPTWLNVSHGIMPPMWLNVSHSFFFCRPHGSCQVSLS